MATIKSFTSLEQSKVLAKILPIESADMRYSPLGDNMHPWIWTDTFIEKDAIPCWSLSALLELLPKKYNNDTVYMPLVGRYYEGNKFICGYFGDGLLDWTFGETPVDACVAMIEKLHEQNLL